MFQRILTIIMLASTLSLASCATTQQAAKPGEPDNQDPLESLNRGTFTFNRKFDKYLFRPIAVGYDYIMPDFVENRLSNFFSNLNMVPTVANDVLQADLFYIFNDTWRFAVNSTFGIGGLFDVGSHIGLKDHHQDFGVTLARWGYRPSSYFVIPFLGPSTIRDGLGEAVNMWATVWPYIDPIWISYSAYGTYMVNMRSAHLEEDELIQQAFDPYVFVRNAYLQNRQLVIESDENSDSYVEGIATSHQTPTSGNNGDKNLDERFQSEDVIEVGSGGESSE